MTSPKRIKGIIGCFLVVLFLTIMAWCLLMRWEKRDELPQTFLAPIDSYMAVTAGDTYPFSFFVVSQEEESFGGKCVSRLSIGGEEGIKFDKVRLSEAERCGRFRADNLMCELIFCRKGRYEFDHITIGFDDGTEEDYAIGRFVIEVFEEKGSEALYTYSTTTMSSNESLFSCTYLKNIENAMFMDLTMDLDASYEILSVDEKQFADGDRGIKQGFAIEVQMLSEKPVAYRFILPRVQLNVEGETVYVYPKVGCYCGGIGVGEQEVINSYLAWNMNEEKLMQEKE